MEDKIRDMLEDIYRIDPSLKSREGELMETLKKLLEVKPDLAPDDEFVAELRRTLLTETQAHSSDIRKKDFFAFVVPKRLVFSLGGMMLLLVIVYSATSQKAQQNPMQENLISSKLAVSQIGEGAFGPLSRNFVDTSGDVGGGPGEGGDIVNYVPYYTYKGGEFSQQETKIEVLKRVLGKNEIKLSGDLAEKLNLGLANLGQTQYMKATESTFCESADYGYCFIVDFKDEKIYANTNDKWAGFKLTGTEEPAFHRQSSEEAIALADEFLKKYQIDLSSYGDPVGIEEEDFGASRVFYPLKINGLDVYYELGNQAGIDVSFYYGDKGNKVSGVYGLETLNYQSSTYEAETDTQTIINAAEQYPNLPYDGETVSVKVELELDTPKRCYGIYDMAQSDGGVQKYLIPSFAFPVKNNEKADEIGGSGLILVPLMKEFPAQK